MGHTDFSDVKDSSKCNLSNASIVPTIKTFFQLLATIHQIAHMLEAVVPAVSQETSYSASH